MVVGEETTTLLPRYVMGPFPERVTVVPVTPGMNPVPVRVTSTVFPVTSVLGEMLVTVGGVFVTVNPSVSWAEVVPPGFVTTTLYVPNTASDGIAKLHLIFVGEATLILVAGMEAAPLVSFTAAPATNPVPARLLMETVDPTTPEFGVMAVTLIPVEVTVKAPNGVTDDFPSGFVMRINHSPVAAPGGMERVPVMVVVVTMSITRGISGEPYLWNFTVAPLTKKFPVMVTGTVAPTAPLDGVMLEKNGGDEITMNSPGAVTCPP